MSSEKTYRYELDLLKGLAIIAVMLYHAGWCKSGYLGVCKIGTLMIRSTFLMNNCTCDYTVKFGIPSFI